MNIDPHKQVLPVYQLLCGGVRLVSILLAGIAISSAISIIINAIVGSGWNLSKFLDAFLSSYASSSLVSFLIVAAILWFGNKHIARWCTPKINLRNCQVCGYDLRHGNTLRCPECGFADPHEGDQD